MGKLAQDKVREALRRLIDERGVDMAAISRAIGRNHAYIQQFLTRGVPSELGYKTALALAEYFDCGPDTFGIQANPHAIRPSNDSAARGDAHAPAALRHPLASIRRLVGLSSAHMAKALGESEAYIAAIEQGREPMTEKLMLKVCRTFHIEPEDLAGYAPAMSPEERVMLLRFRRLNADQRARLEKLLDNFEKERA